MSDADGSGYTEIAEAAGAALSMKLGAYRDALEKAAHAAGYSAGFQAGCDHAFTQMRLMLNKTETLLKKEPS